MDWAFRRAHSPPCRDTRAPKSSFARSHSTASLPPAALARATLGRSTPMLSQDLIAHMSAVLKPALALARRGRLSAIYELVFQFTAFRRLSEIGEPHRSII